jgi:hypothetical protein
MNAKPKVRESVTPVTITDERVFIVMNIVKNRLHN